ncbi:MAG TPA: tyrosine-protein phosphatase [Thermoanaerobaculia bacterium]|nr:tyrosine-protein phosphatase [Thermoanaerobaculia bacterium]
MLRFLARAAALARAPPPANVAMIRSAAALTWVPAGRGRLAILHRPKLALIPHLPRLGCDHVATLLSEKEGGDQIGARVRDAGLGWTWLPLPDARPPQGRRNQPVHAALAALAAELDAGRSLLVHCSAGIHRTGMFAYALLRWIGNDEAAALSATRPLTRDELSEERLRWANELIEAARRGKEEASGS